MDQVKIRAVVAAHGLTKNAEVTVAATPTIEGAIRNGVFKELERYPSEPVEPPQTDGDQDQDPEPPKTETTRRRG